MLLSTTNYATIITLQFIFFTNSNHDILPSHRESPHIFLENHVPQPLLLLSTYTDKWHIFWKDLYINCFIYVFLHHRHMFTQKFVSMFRASLMTLLLILEVKTYWWIPLRWKGQPSSLSDWRVTPLLFLRFYLVVSSSNNFPQKSAPNFNVFCTSFYTFR